MDTMVLGVLGDIGVSISGIVGDVWMTVDEQSVLHTLQQTSAACYESAYRADQGDVISSWV